MSENKDERTDDLRASLIKDGYLAADFDQHPQRPDEEKMADESLSIQLLAGYDVEKGTTKPLKHNSPEERKARAALARIVRERMPGFSGELLALAIDTRTPSTWPGMKAARRIKFESSTRGKPSTFMRNTLVVDFIRKQRFNSNDGKLEPCLAAAEKHFNLKRARVHEIWHAHETILDRAASTK
jgi:hypothetical protein